MSSSAPPECPLGGYVSKKGDDDVLLIGKGVPR